MKTFDEALMAAIGKKPDEDMSLRFHDATELACDIVESKFAREYISDLVGLSVHEDVKERIDNPDFNEVNYFNFLMSLAMSAFAVGVRVGMHMEKQEITEEPVTEG